MGGGRTCKIIRVEAGLGGQLALEALVDLDEGDAPRVARRDERHRLEHATEAELVQHERGVGRARRERVVGLDASDLPWGGGM